MTHLETITLHVSHGRAIQDREVVVKCQIKTSNWRCPHHEADWCTDLDWRMGDGWCLSWFAVCIWQLYFWRHPAAHLFSEQVDYNSNAACKFVLLTPSNHQLPSTSLTTSRCDYPWLSVLTHNKNHNFPQVPGPSWAVWWRTDTRRSWACGPWPHWAETWVNFAGSALQFDN